MNKLAFLSITLLLFCVAPALHAATQAMSPEMEALLSEAQGQASGKQSGALILLKDVTFKRIGTNSSVCTFHIIGKVFDDVAANHYSQIYFPFNTYYDDVELDFARSVSPNGVVTSTPPNAIQVKNQNSAAYSDQRILAFAIPALTAGSFFEFQVSEKQKKPVMDKGWSHAFGFAYLTWGRIDPVHLSRFTLSVPREERLSYEVQNTAAEPAVQYQGTMQTYRWEIKDLPEIKPERDMPCPIHELTPRLRLSSLESWADIDTWAAEKFMSKVQPVEEVQKKAEELVRDAKTRREKIAILFNFVQERIRYIQADLATGGYSPRPPADVLRDQFGDCKDQTTLLLSLLKAVGIDAYPALLDVCSGVKHSKIPVLEFNHVITYVPDPEGDLWLDATSGVSEFPYLLSTDQGKRVLVVDGKGGRFLTTPEAGPDTNQLSVALTFVPDNGHVRIAMKVNAKGALSNFLKSKLMAASENARKEAMTNFYEHLGYKATNVSVAYPDLTKIGTPFSSESMFEAEGSLNSKRPISYSGRVSPLLDLLFGPSSLTKPDERKYDLRLPFKGTATMEWHCPPPMDNMKLEGSLQQPAGWNNRFFDYKETHTKEGEALRVRAELQLKENIIKKEDYREFYDAAQKMAGAYTTWRATFSVPLSGLQKFFRGLR